MRAPRQKYVRAVAAGAIALSMTTTASVPSALVVGLLVVAAAYGAYRLGWFDAFLNVIAPGSAAAAGSKKGSSTPRGSGGGTTAPGRKRVKDRYVVFEGGAPGEATCCGCDHYDPNEFPAANRVAGDGCKVRVDACALVGGGLPGAAPPCHTVASLCKSKVVPSQLVGNKVKHWGDGQTDMTCALQERCGGGCGGWGDSYTKNYMRSITIPEGLALEVNKGSTCALRSAWWTVCMNGSSGCRWEQDVYQNDPGLQFSVAPGYELQCGATTHQGPPSPAPAQTTITPR